MIYDQHRGGPQPQTPTDALATLRAQWRSAGPEARREIEQTARAVAIVRAVLRPAPED